MIKIYGSPRTSAGRCFLVLEELGLKYEVAPLDMKEKREHKSESFLKLNPNGKVPCLIDGDFVIWESLAINHYLVDKYRPELLGKTSEERGLVQQWSVWALVELQPPMVDMIIQLMFVPENKRDMSIVAKAKDRIPPYLSTLNHALKDKTYLVGGHLTLADLNVFSIVNIAISLKIPLNEFQHIEKWMTELKKRPSFQKLAELRG